jgi:hypothetical protein
MYTRNPGPGRPVFTGFGGFGGFGGPPPRDIIALLVVVFATFALQFFAATAPLVGLLRLTPAVWQRGYLWQLATYPFIGYGGPSIWFLLELLILYWFARDVYWRIGRRKFWSLLGWGTVAAGLAALATALVATWIPAAEAPAPFTLMQGQRTLLVIVIAAFATLFAQATVYLFFILPVQARWFLWLEIRFAFMGFLGTHDLPGFVGICVAVGVTNRALASTRLDRSLRELWLRLEQRRIRWKLDRMRRRRGMRLVKGKGGDAPDEAERRRREPWVH